MARSISKINSVVFEVSGSWKYGYENMFLSNTIRQLGITSKLVYAMMHTTEWQWGWWAAFPQRWCFEPPWFHSHATQHEQYDQLFYRIVYQTLQVCVFVCTSKPEFENVVPDGARCSKNILVVKILVLIYRKLGLGTVSET